MAERTVTGADDVGRTASELSGIELEVQVDQDACTGDGLCVTYAPEVFEFDIDGLAYVKGPDGALQQEPGARVGVPCELVTEVLNSAEGCPGDCIHIARAGTDDWVAGPRRTGR
ncbi:MAG TPA: ferredoxin [Mycobacteriales bacterium]|nr:ferredoxin [Mycobacteriales bacterium]